MNVVLVDDCAPVYLKNSIYRLKNLMTHDVSHSAASASSDDEISLAEIGATLAAHKWKILLCAVVAALIAAGVALSMTPIFRAEVLIAPAKEGDSRGGLSALAGQFAGLGSLAGIGFGGGSDKSQAVATLSSRALTERYIHDQNLLPVLFPHRWDSAKEAFTPNSRGKVPTLWDGNKLFNGIRAVAEDKKTGLVTLSIEWKDPQQAAQWANDLVKLANSTLRNRAIADSNRNLDYLNEQLEKTGVVEVRQAIYRLLETEVKNIMVAQGSEEYAFKVIDPAVVPQDKSRPKRSLITLAGGLFGLMLAALYYALARRVPTQAA